MPDRVPSPERPRLQLSSASIALRLAGIGLVVLAAAGGFAYVAGYLDPQRLTPDKFVNTLEHNNGVFPGLRRNHPKGVCVAGYFEGNSAASGLSTAQVFTATRTPVVGRFALPTGNPYSPDSAVPIRSLALRFTQADGQQWRTGMNAMPVFPVGTPQAFFELLQATAPDPATGKPDPAKPAAFFASHPETGPFLAWVKGAKPSASYTSLIYNSVNAFYLVNAEGKRQAVRWNMVPADSAESATAAPDEKDYLETDLARRIATAPLRFNLILTLADSSDPVDDASKQWPSNRPTVNAGSLVLQSEQPQSNGACRDVNFDPLILPSGISGSADPLLAARSAAYATSYKRRTAEGDQSQRVAPVTEKKS